MLKPDNFERRSRRPGNIIDVFSRTGLRIVGTRLFNMTVGMGEEFYGPLKDIFVKKLKGNVAQEIYERLHNAFRFPFTMHDAETMSDLLAERNAEAEFNRIVEYMTGVNPEEVPDPRQKRTASRTKCLAMLYEGPDAIEKIRRVLGSHRPHQGRAGHRPQRLRPRPDAQRRPRQRFPRERPARTRHRRPGRGRTPRRGVQGDHRAIPRGRLVGQGLPIALSSQGWWGNGVYRIAPSGGRDRQGPSGCWGPAAGRPKR